jgi:anti-sigma-K factor RskA
VDIQQFISSGIIEAYVLGMASEEEVRELETLSALHPEIAAALAEVQQSMGDYALLHAVQPPPGLKEQIWSALEKETLEIPDDATHNRPEHVREFIRPETQITKRSYGPLAATVALLIGSVLLNFIFWNKSERTEKELASVQTKQQEIIASNQEFKQQLLQSQKNMHLVMDPAMKPVALAGVGIHISSQAMVFWDTRSKEVYLALKNMPPPPAGKQYQLWAIVNGKPVDAGVFALRQNAAMQKMKVIPSAEMFAITLEKEGGSEVPTMEEMYVAGKV